jgi:hypothetical protein
MGMLLFSPWMTVKEPIQVGNLCFEPYFRSKQNGASFSENDLSVIAKITSPYTDGSNRPIQSCSIGRLKGKPLFADLSTKERNSAFQDFHLLTFLALADRKFFTHLSNYCNKSDFTLVAQGFRDDRPSEGVSIQARRRDGSTSKFFSNDIFFSRCPPHVNQLKSFSMPAEKVSAFAKAMEQADESLWDALVGFISANTDAFTKYNRFESAPPRNYEFLPDGPRKRFFNIVAKTGRGYLPHMKIKSSVLAVLCMVWMRANTLCAHDLSEFFYTEELGEMTVIVHAPITIVEKEGIRGIVETRFRVVRDEKYFVFKFTDRQVMVKDAKESEIFDTLRAQQADLVEKVKEALKAKKPIRFLVDVSGKTKVEILDRK